MITNFFIPELNNHDVQELGFQQEGATCHTARATIDLLKYRFGDRLISRFGPVNRSPRSCDLTPLDYFLWGYVKSSVYADKPQALDHLEDNIRLVIAYIRPQMLEKVIENWTSRLDYIRASLGGHMPEIIFKIYTRAFGDGPPNFEPLSSDRDDTGAGSPSLTTTPDERQDVCALDRFNVHKLLTLQVLSGTELELVTCLTLFDTLTTGLPQPQFVNEKSAEQFSHLNAFDEAHFWLNGYVDKQNCRIWSEANPQVYVETPLHPEKLTVWCALWAGGIIGPYFFKNDEGHNVTVNGDRYIAMITNLFILELNNHVVQELWFQQDGATCRTARATNDLLKDTFGDRLISRFGPVNWPPRSCDLTPLEYFLWGYVKSLVYADKPQTLDHLEDNIRLVIAYIRPQMLEKVIEN
ncbi:transposable element Tc3 transposase [Trichonephila clavipes]|nr:transposable element Tc3 transposase [Trichonephila clavipes]